MITDLKYVDKLLTFKRDKDYLINSLINEAKNNISFFKDDLESNESIQVNICTIVSEYSGCKISTEVLQLLEIEHHEDEAIEILEDIEHEINKKLDELLKDFPDYITKDNKNYSVNHYISFLEDNGYCLIQSISKEESED